MALCKLLLSVKKKKNRSHISAQACNVAILCIESLENETHSKIGKNKVPENTHNAPALSDNPHALENT